MDENPDVHGRGFRVFLSELVDIVAAIGHRGEYRHLYFHDGGRLYLPPDVGAVHKPPVEEQPHGRRVQHGKRILPAGNKAH